MQQLIEGVQHEINFWKRFVRSDHFLNEWVADKICNELHEQHEVVNLIVKQWQQNPDIKVLDCGSGAVSILHGLIPDRNISACDLLAEEYKEIFTYEKYGIAPPVKLSAEELNEIEKYDVVHMRNALDHTQDIAKAFYNLLKACKTGGHLVIHGFSNEGEYEKYRGLHQWNITAVNDELVIRDKEKILMRMFGMRGFTKTLSSGKEWFTWILKK